MRIKFSEAAKATDATAHYPQSGVDLLLRKCVTDSRESGPGSLFCCLKGENSDGHDFAKAAIAKGASAILCARKLPELNVPQLVVADVIPAMGKLARYWRDRCGTFVIAITGTAGKTTLKDTLTAILSQAGKTGCSQKNHNNQIGLPCSMLNLDGDEKFWVLEAGISHEKDMDELGDIIHPDLAIIINIGAGHEQGLFKKGVAWHKGRLLAHVKKGGQAILSSDYPELLDATQDYDLPKIFFSLKNNGQYHLKSMDAVKGEYTFCLNDREFTVTTPFRGLYGAEIAGLATTCANMFNLSCEQIQRGFEHVSFSGQRFQTLSKGSWKIIDDTYNANPLSMRRMLETAAMLADQENMRLLTVLGEMGELGERSSFWHRDLGKQLAQINPAAIFWRGAHFEDVLAGYQGAGGANSMAAFETEQDFLRKIQTWLSQEDVLIIFKGSRVNKLENYLQTLLQANQETGTRHVL